MFVRSELFSDMPNLRKGTIMDFYLGNSYRDMAASMKEADCNALHKTIHKAKGEEFNNVLLIAGSDISFLTNPNIENNATHRVYYVGMSRAKRNLFINVDSISAEEMDSIRQIPITIIHL